MIGNDVVDLALARLESNRKTERYLNKITTSSEQKLIQSSENQELAFWSFWTRKEAVYKLIRQIGGPSGYYPIKIECLDFNLKNGIVQYENQLFYTKTQITKNYIYSIAVVNEQDFKKVKPFKNTSLIFKVEGIPHIIFENEIKVISKTHHGNFERMVYLDA